MLTKKQQPQYLDKHVNDVFISLDDKDTLTIDLRFTDKARIAYLLSSIITGAITNNLLQALANACETDEDVESIITQIYEIIGMMDEVVGDNVNSPVIDPTRVFSGGNKNEFKG